MSPASEIRAPRLAEGVAPASSRSAVFLDRDGVIVENRSDYVKRWEEVCFLPGALAALRRLSRSGHAVVLVTNQSAVGRGVISLEQAVALNRRLIGAIELHGGRVDAWYLCPHQPDDECTCRKPAPGMLLQAGFDLGLNLEASWLIGDASTDIGAARAAGVRPILVRTGRGNDQADLLLKCADACPVVADLQAALDHIL
jgi:D-glycero-D-manno-heptose 1,7-bisphosphate phosphatase